MKIGAQEDAGAHQRGATVRKREDRGRDPQADSGDRETSRDTPNRRAGLQCSDPGREPARRIAEREESDPNTKGGESKGRLTFRAPPRDDSARDFKWESGHPPVSSRADPIQRACASRACADPRATSRATDMLGIDHGGRGNRRRRNTCSGPTRRFWSSRSLLMKDDPLILRYGERVVRVEARV